jgi:mannosyl-3-phosphoglycerate synthase
MAKSPYSMVRILWRYKPKDAGGLFFKRLGRVPAITNKCINMLISTKTGFETEIIKTGNASEHAISIKLAEILPYASGYAVEPQELLSIFEGFGGILPMSSPTATKYGVEVFQIETRNPHLHEARGKGHQDDRLLTGLGAIYHSPLCENDTKQVILDELTERGIIKSKKIPKPHIITPPKKTDLTKFKKVMEEHEESYSILDSKR